MQQVFVAPTGRTGKGLFANVAFAAGQTILVVEGTVQTSTYDADYEVGPTWIGIDDRTWLVPTPDGHAAFLNHSCEANAVIAADRTLVAIAPIAKGQEISIDYSTTEADPYWRMTCQCGTPHCRGVVGAVHSLPSDIYERYRPYLASFVQRARDASCAQ